MAFVVSGAALARARSTIAAAVVFRQEARGIARSCLDGGTGEVIIAAVGPDQAFRGIWIVPAADLRERVLALDNGGWSLIFAPATPLDVVEERCTQLHRLAQMRLTAMERWLRRRGPGA